MKEYEFYNPHPSPLPAGEGIISNAVKLISKL
jgi:hypothetical protein